MTREQHEENARDFIGMSNSPELCRRIDRTQLAEQMQYTIWDAEDIEAIAALIEEIANQPS